MRLNLEPPGIYLDKQITGLPWQINTKDFRREQIKSCTDEKLVIDRTKKEYWQLVLGSFLSIVLGFVLLEFFNLDMGNMKGSSLLTIIIFIIVYALAIVVLLLFEFSFLLLALNGIFGKKVIIFNRERGTVTYPAFGELTTQTRPFGDIQFILRLGSPKYGGRHSSSSGRRLLIKRSDGLTCSLVNYGARCEAFYSFYVWYMDKNRPLPPGDALDPFREKDYLRRKKEGFPKPMYPANIDIEEKEGIPT